MPDETAIDNVLIELYPKFVEWSQFQVDMLVLRSLAHCDKGRTSLAEHILELERIKFEKQLTGIEMGYTDHLHKPCLVASGIART